MSIVSNGDNSLQQDSAAATMGDADDLPQPEYPDKFPAGFKSEDFFCENFEKLPKAELYVENLFKMMKQLDDYQGFHVDIWDVGPLLDFFDGPLLPISNFDSHKYLSESARVALGSYNKEKGTSLELKNLVKANWNCAGHNIYNITLEASDGLFYETTVSVGNSISGILYNVKFIRPAKFYPMKEDSH